MNVLTISDLHGSRPEDLPPADVLIIAGDLISDCSDEKQELEFEKEFVPWLQQLDYKVKVCIPGNHDFFAERYEPKLLLGSRNGTTWFLNNSLLRLSEFGGLDIWGSPFVSGLPAWAFNRQEWQIDEALWSVPKGIPIIISHAPPRGYGDTLDDGRSVGSNAVLECVMRTEPRLVVFGHIHEGRGSYKITHDSGKETLLENASFLDKNYLPYKGTPKTLLLDF